MIRDRMFGRRPWVFTHRYYSPNGWRVPYVIWTRRWNYYASGKLFTVRLSYLHAVWRKPREATSATGETAA